MLKLEKSKMAAKQTVRVKSPATSNVLQAKITLLKSTSRDDSRTTVPAMEIGPRTSSVSNTDIQVSVSHLLCTWMLKGEVLIRWGDNCIHPHLGILEKQS